MQKKLRKENFVKAAIAAVFSVVALLALYLGNGLSASAMTTAEAVTTVISPLYDDTAKKFDSAALTELYKQLGGKNCDTLAKIKELIPATNNKIYSSSSIRLNNWTGENDVVVELGGKKWTVASLTSTRASGGKSDVIATLWLASAEETCQFNNWYAASETWEYPSNMYGSSKMRAFLNGTMYAKSDTVSPSDSYRVSLTDGSSVQSPPWKAFIDKYKMFIETPSKIEYQETEYSLQGVTIWNNMQNEAYGTPAGLRWWAPQCNYSDKNMYSDWAGDYLWIPSVTEIGFSGGASGLWEISDWQRRDDGSTGTRSGYWSSGNGVEMISSAGTSVQSNLTHAYFGVRPAIHLNLSTAELSAGGMLAAPEKTVTIPSIGSAKPYSGVSQKIVITGSDAELISVVGSSADITVASDYSYFKVTNAGEYSLVCTLNNSSEGYRWPDGTYGTKYIYFTVEPYVSAVTWGNTQLTYSGKQLAPTARAVDYQGNSLSLDTVYRRQGEASVLDAAPTDAGTYVAEASFSENQNNYVLSGGTCTFTISKATPEIIPVIGGETLYAGGKLPEISAPSGSVSGKCVWIETQLTEGVNVAEWVFIPDDAVNYSVISGSCTLIAQKSPPKRIVWGDTEFVYDGRAHAPAAYYVNDGGEKVMLAVTGAMSAAGEYTATVITDGVPYALEGELSKNFTVSRREITLIWQSGQWTYNGAAQSPSVTVVTDYDDGNVLSLLSVVFTAKNGSSLTDGKAVEAGDYIAEVTLPDVCNYKLAGKTSFSFTVGISPQPGGEISYQPLSNGAIAGIVIGCIAFVVLAVSIALVIYFRARARAVDYDQDGFYDDADSPY